MQNLVDVLAIETNPRAIIPCIRIARGVWVASSEQNATFSIEMKFLYTVSGRQAPTLTSTQFISAMTFHSEIDARNTDVHAQSIALQGQPDPGSQIQVTSRVIISDRAGTRIEVSDVSTGSFPVG